MKMYRAVEQNKNCQWLSLGGDFGYKTATRGIFMVWKCLS